MQNKIEENTVKRFAGGDMRAFDEIYFVFSPKHERAQLLSSLIRP